MPETPSTMFDHTVSMSLPIGVMKPIPVTATRRPLELVAMTQGYGRQGLSTLAHSVKTGPVVWTRRPNWPLEELAEIQSQLQSETGRRGVEVASKEIAQLVQAIEHCVPVQLQRRGGILHRATREVRLQRIEQLVAIASLGIQQGTEAVMDEAFGQPRVLRQDQLRNQLVMPVDDGVGAQLAPDFDRLLGFEIRAGDASQPGVVAADNGTHPGPRGSRALDRLLLQAHHQLLWPLRIGGGLGRPQDDDRGRIARVMDRATWQLKRRSDLRQRLSALLAVPVADDQLAYRSDVTGGGDWHVQRQRLLLQLEVRVEVVADQGVEQTRTRPSAALHVLLSRVQVGLGHLCRHLVQGGEDVVGGDHDRLGSCLWVTPPCAKDRVPRNAGRDAISIQDRFDRLAAARLQDAELGHPAKLLGSGGARFAGGSQEQVEA